MSWVVTYLYAARLVWGVIRVGAPSYCPDQTDEYGRSCYSADCTDIPARCTVERVWGSPQSGYWVRLEASTTEDKP